MNLRHKTQLSITKLHCDETVILKNHLINNHLMLTIH